MMNMHADFPKICAHHFECMIWNEEWIWLPCMENANLIATYIHTHKYSLTRSQCMYFLSHCLCNFNHKFAFRNFDEVHRFANKINNPSDILIILLWLLCSTALWNHYFLCICITKIVHSYFHDICFFMFLFCWHKFYWNHLRFA